MFERKRKSGSRPSSGRSEITSVVAINGRFLLAAVLMFVAYELWPTRPEWWGLGLISLCVGAGATAHAIAGLREMFRLIERNHTVSDQTKDAAETKQARKVTNDVLRDAGMKR